MAMTKPSQFAMHSGYATLKNNDNGTISLTIPSGSTVGASATRAFTADIVLGKAGGSIRARGKINTGAWMPCPAILIYMNEEIPDYGTGIIQNPHTAYLRWVNATTIRLQVDVQNYAPATLYIRSAYTVTFKINTFLPPV